MTHTPRKGSGNAVVEDCIKRGLRLDENGQIIVNRTALGYGDGDGEWRCIASECMAWRSKIIFGTKVDLEKNTSEPYSEMQGYCGLAGKP